MIFKLLPGTPTCAPDATTWYDMVKAYSDKHRQALIDDLSKTLAESQMTLTGNLTLASSPNDPNRVFCDIPPPSFWQVGNFFSKMSAGDCHQRLLHCVRGCGDEQHFAKFHRQQRRPMEDLQVYWVLHKRTVCGCGVQQSVGMPWTLARHLSLRRQQT
jgi:hypothetical protein